MLIKTIKSFLGCAAVVTAFAAPLVANAELVPITLFNTGVDGTGVGLGGLALGGADTHYDITTLTSDPIVVTNAAYLPNTALSQWIWIDSLSSPTTQTYTFTTTFDLTGLNDATALINGRWATDNSGVSIKLNGVSEGFSIPGSSTNNFKSWNEFSISSGFVEGINTLSFTVKNISGPGAFRIELTGTGSTVPEPGSLALLGLALAGLGYSRRRK